MHSIKLNFTGMGLGMTNKSEIFKSAHVAAKRAMAEQREIKHPSAHKTYKQLFALCLKGCYINMSKPYERNVEPVKFMWWRG